MYTFDEVFWLIPGTGWLPVPVEFKAILLIPVKLSLLTDCRMGLWSAMKGVLDRSRHTVFRIELACVFKRFAVHLRFITNRNVQVPQYRKRHVLGTVNGCHLFANNHWNVVPCGLMESCAPRIRLHNPRFPSGWGFFPDKYTVEVLSLRELYRYTGTLCMVYIMCRPGWRTSPNGGSTTTTFRRQGCIYWKEKLSVLLGD